VYWLQDFEGIIRNDDSCKTIYINTNEHYRAVETETREARFVKWWKDKYPAHTVAKQPNLQRSFVKESEELDLIQACTITEKDSESSIFRETKCDGIRNRS
jgi:Xaa-Pro aminopeptidase